MNLSTLPAQSRLLSGLMLFVLAVLVFASVMELASVRDHARLGERLIVYRLPVLFYLWAIWAVSRAVAAVGRGDLFDRVVPRLLRGVGFALLLGGLASVFLVPNLLRIMDGRGGFMTYDVAAITLGVVGLSLVVVAQLLRMAADMRAELDEMF